MTDGIPVLYKIIRLSQLANRPEALYKIPHHVLVGFDFEELFWGAGPVKLQFLVCNRLGRFLGNR